MIKPVEALHWRTSDLAHIANASEVWELTTFWSAPDGTVMATLERVSAGVVSVAHAPVFELRRVDT